MVRLAPSVLFIATILTASHALRWTSFAVIPPGSSVEGCHDQNITLPWQYEVEDLEHIIDVEWYFQGEGETEKKTLASYVMENFLTSSSINHKLSYLPNAGLVLHDVTSSQSGAYTVQINLSLHGALVTDTQTVHLHISETQCTDNALETTKLRIQLDQLTADIDILRQHNANLSALYQQLLTTCTETAKPRNCRDILTQHRTSGVYTIYLSDESALQVYCDQNTDGGGWTVIQRRQDGSVHFNRSWSSYQDGFGNLRGDFWLGLSHIHQLSANQTQALRVDLTDWDNTMAYAIYNTFYIAGANDSYRLHVSGYQGTAGDALNSTVYNRAHNRMPFATYDNHSQYNTCAIIFSGGWWYNDCYATNLNGRYRNDEGDPYSPNNQGVTWYDWHNDWRSYKHAEMKIRN